MSNYRDNLLPGRRAREAQDFAERNLVLTAHSFDAEHTIQIRCGAAVLCTVSEPAGPGGEPSVFNVYRENLNYREETDYEAVENFLGSFYVANYHGDVAATYREAVKYAYGYAIKRVVNELLTVEA